MLNRRRSAPGHLLVTVKVAGALDPEAVITMTGTGPTSASAGTVVWASMGLVTLMEALASPKSASVAPVRCVPWRTTCVPAGPEVGESEVMAGG